jgi:hypothetical protein
MYKGTENKEDIVIGIKRERGKKRDIRERQHEI